MGLASLVRFRYGDQSGADSQWAVEAIVAPGIPEKRDAHLQRMDAAGGPVAAERQGLGGELRLQERAGVEAPVTRTAAQDGGVASQFLVQAHDPRAQVDQRVEPAEGLHRGGQGGGPGIVAGDVLAPLGAGQRALLVGEGTAAGPGRAPWR